MIWFRRIIALPLALVFVVLFLVLLIVGRVNATVGSPDFYAGQLEQADVYNFVYDEALPEALDEVALEGQTGLPLDFAVLKPHIVDFARETLPPEWLQAQAEAALGEIVPYAVGDTAHFNLSLPLKDRVAAGLQAFSTTLQQEGVFSSVYNGILDQAFSEASLAEAGLAGPFALNDAELTDIVTTVIPEDWVLQQFDGAIQEVTPYFTGDAEHFTVTVALAGRLDALEPVAAEILAREVTYNYIFDNVIAPAVLANSGQLGSLSDLLTEADVAGVLKEALPLEWYRARVGEIARDIFAYLRGEQDTVQIVIPVGDRWPVVAAALTDVIDQKMAARWDSLPTCSAAELVEIVLNPLSNFPPQCKPPLVTYAMFKASLDFAVVLTPLLDSFLPQEFVITDAELRGMLSGDSGEDILAQGRDIIQNGFTYTDADLRADLGEAEYASLQEMRAVIAEGLAYSDADLHRAVADAGDEAGWEQYQVVRASIGQGRSLFWLAWLVPVLLLAGIGALGGRSWRGRVIWAAAVLALGAVVAYIAFGPVFQAMAAPLINEALTTGTAGTGGIEGLFLGKMAQIAENSVASFVGGINIQALVVLGVAVVAILLAALLPRSGGYED